MVRQAKAYLAGAVSGTVLIAVAIGVFVLLVSLQVFRDWPVAGLGGTDEEVAAPAAAGAASGANGEVGGVAAASDGTEPGSGSGSGRSPGSGGGDLADEVGGGGGGQPSATGGGQSGVGSSGPGGSGGGGSSPGGGSAGGGSGTGSPSGELTETVNETVQQVDETVLGGALGEAGVTEITEGALDGVAGPESTAGKAVDGTVEAVGGVLGGDH